MADIDISVYIPTIENILMNSVHSEITARDVRLKLEQKFKVDLTSRKHEVQQLVERCFDALEMSDKETGDSELGRVEVKKQKKHVHAEERRHKSLAKSHEKDKSKGKKLTKSRVNNHVSDYSSLEDDKPSQKRKRGRKRKSSLIDSDAEFERKLEEELNGKKSKSKSNGSSKKKPPHKKKRKDNDEGDEEKKKRKGVTGIHKPLVLSPVLSEFLNAEELSRLEVVKRLWDYIKKNDLQDPNDKRFIVCDEKLMSIFKHERIHSFTMNKYLTDHLKKKEDLVVKAEQGNSSSINEDDHDHDYALNDDHSEGIGIKTETSEETQYKFDDDNDDDHSESVNANTGEFGGDDDEEWAQD